MFTAQNSTLSTATRYILASAGCMPQSRLSMYVYYGRFGCGLADKIVLHFNREQNYSLSSRQELKKLSLDLR